MKALIVYTHPNRESLNGAFLKKSIEGLKKNSSLESYEVLDLYGEEFNPVLIFNDKIKRRDMFKLPELARYREQIKNADTIIMIYPIWWGRPPAMLLGYIDRLFSTNFAYRFTQGKIMPEGLLKDKRVYCITTMQGPRGYLQLFMGNVHQILMKKVLFNFVGIKKVKFFEFGGMEKKEGKQKRYLSRIETFLSKI